MKHLQNRRFAWMEAVLYFRKYYSSDNDFVCVNDKNRNHYTRRQIERTLERIVLNSRCRDKAYSPHSLRHGYGSILLSMGTEIRLCRNCWDIATYLLLITYILMCLIRISMMRSWNWIRFDAYKLINADFHQEQDWKIGVYPIK